MPSSPLAHLTMIPVGAPSIIVLPAPRHEIKDNLPKFQEMTPILVSESDATNSVLCQLTRPLFNSITFSA